jgi:hypothetical protein
LRIIRAISGELIYRVGLYRPVSAALNGFDAPLPEGEGF